MSELDRAEQDRKALEGFLIENEDLERLEALLDRFNIFEAIGVVRQELRHSDFLAFLLDPRESHGLGDAFVKRLLQRVLTDAPNSSAPVSAIETSLCDLTSMTVMRGWKHIDIFLLDERNRLAVIVENKVDTGRGVDLGTERRWRVAGGLVAQPSTSLAMTASPGIVPSVMLSSRRARSTCR